MTAHQRPNVRDEPGDRVDIRHPVHGSDEDKFPRRARRRGRRTEEVDIDPSWDRRYPSDAVRIPERVAVDLRYGNHVIKASALLSLEGLHAAGLLGQVRPQGKRPGDLRTASPDRRFDIVLEQHRRNSESDGNVDSRHEEITHQKIDSSIMDRERYRLTHRR